MRSNRNERKPLKNRIRMYLENTLPSYTGGSVFLVGIVVGALVGLALVSLAL
jgi:hypothetical protein